MNTNKRKNPYTDYYKKMSPTQRQMYDEGDIASMPNMMPPMMPMYQGDMSSSSSEVPAYTSDCDSMMPVMPANIVFARAYVPFQCYTQAYSPQEALMRGTLFPELDQPQWFIKPTPK